MKYFILIFLFNFKSYSEDHISCYSKKDIKRFYYANGIYNELDKEVEKAIRDLKNNFNLETILPLYNPTNSFVNDIIETLSQIRIDRARTENYQERKIIGNDEATSISKGFINKLEKNKDKKHFIFAHSQGNLFTNFMCDLKDQELHMEVISIAPPTESLKCNSLGTYVLFENDVVINSLRVRALAQIDSKYKALKSNYVDPILNPDPVHHYLRSYLQHEKSFPYLKKQLDKTIELTYKKYYSIPVATLEIQPDSTIDKAIDSIKDTKESVSLWMREKKAFMNTVNYASSFTDITKYKSKNGFKQLLATQIPAENEQEFADMIAYSLNAIVSQCDKNLSPNLAKLCHKVELKNYFDTKEKFKPFLETSQFKDTKFLLNCETIIQFYDFLNGKPLDVKLNFTKKSPIISFNDQEQDLKLLSISSSPLSQSIGSFQFNRNETTKEYSVNFNFSAKPSKETTEEVAQDDEFKKCNSLIKLSSVNCRDFLKKIDKNYFTSSN